MTQSATTTKNIPETCHPETGRLKPVVNRSKCEAKADCVAVCPYQVFEVRRLLPEERKDFSLTGRLKLFAHGGKQAFVVRAEDCHACGLCVTSCPEKAIKLIKY